VPGTRHAIFTRAIEKVWLARSRSYARACGADAGRLLEHMTTIDAAKDMDQIRGALGQGRPPRTAR
jgi:hypothetical protein